ncbi:hypothetical protein D3C85_1930070 [compost metagenome]
MPLPLEPYDNLPGEAFARATRLLTSVAGDLALTTSTLGTSATVVIGAKLFSKS